MSRKLRIVVDRVLCEANGVCAMSALDVFEITEDDRMRVLVDWVPEGRLEAVQAAVRGCPKGALSLVEEG